MKTIEELTEELEALYEARNLIQEKIDNFEPDESEYEDQYNEMLDDCYPEVFNILPSRILLECDPISYNCGLSDYVDSLELDDMEEYQDLTSELDDVNSNIEDLEEQIEDLD